MGDGIAHVIELIGKFVFRQGAPPAGLFLSSAEPCVSRMNVPKRPTNNPSDIRMLHHQSAVSRLWPTRQFRL